MHRDTELHLAVTPYKNGCGCPECGRRDRIGAPVGGIRVSDGVGEFPDGAGLDLDAEGPVFLADEGLDLGGDAARHGGQSFPPETARRF